MQNRAARFIASDYSRHSSITAMKSSLSLSYLSTRYKMSQLCLLHKIYEANPILKESLLRLPFHVLDRVNHRKKIKTVKSKTITHYHSFQPSTSKEWNDLPPSTININDTAHLHSAVCAYMPQNQKQPHG